MADRSDENPHLVRVLAMRGDYLASLRNVAWVAALEKARAKPLVGTFQDDGWRDDIWFLANPARRYRVRPWRLRDGGRNDALEGTVTVKDRLSPRQVVGQPLSLLTFYGFKIPAEDSDRYGQLWLDLSAATLGFRTDRLSAKDREEG